MNDLRELLAKATPGPWRWAGSVQQPMITTVDRGMVYVMCFIRSGMQGAQPTFQVMQGDAGVMMPASALAVREVSYRDDIVDINHPDARLLIALRNNADALLAVVEAARALNRFAYHEVGWFEGRTEGWSCIKFEDAEREHELAAVLDEALQRLDAP